MSLRQVGDRTEYLIECIIILYMIKHVINIPYMIIRVLISIVLINIYEKYNQYILFAVSQDPVAVTVPLLLPCQPGGQAGRQAA